MVNTLSKKFVKTAMLAISILLIILIGTINVINFKNTNDRSWESLDKISRVREMSKQAPEGVPEKPEIQPGDVPPQQGERNEYDTYMASNFFMVEYDADGNVSKTDVSRTSLVSEDEAVKMAEKVVETGKSEGEEGDYIYSIQTVAETGESSVVFLDVANNRRMALNVLGVSMLVGLVCWLLMLLITILLSKKAIKPIAENMEKQKQFITDAGHELKTPLAIIQANSDAMELYNGENKWSSNIKLQVERLTKLTNDLLSLAKMDEENAHLKKDNVNLSEELQALIDGFEQSCENKGLSIKAEIQENIQLRCNRSDIEKLLGILIDNAVKYSKESADINIKLNKSSAGASLVIENECESLPKVEPNKLFERFYRSDEARTQESGGCGIGLSMAKSIVEAHGGKISAEYIGEIIRFTVEL